MNNAPKYLEHLDDDQILQSGDGWFRANGYWVEVEGHEIGKEAVGGIYFRPTPSYRTIVRSDGYHCDVCGYMDCECLISRFECPKGHVAMIAESSWKHCLKCGIGGDGKWVDMDRVKGPWVLQPNKQIGGSEGSEDTKENHG
jgi:hypothetical protein